MDPAYVNIDTEDAVGIEKRDQFLFEYGRLMAIWSQFELAVEIAIGRLSGMDALHSSIVLGDLLYGKKKPILISLLHLVGDHDAISAVKRVDEAAKRNAIVHSLPDSTDDYERFAFIGRAWTPYKVKHNEYNCEEFTAHVEEFLKAYEAAVIALGVTRSSVAAYSRDAGLNWPATSTLSAESEL